MSNELYKNFYQTHLENKALETLKKVTGNMDLNLTSTVINEFGQEVNVGKEIKEYISVMGEDILKNLENIDNKIDEWFFKYRLNTTENIDKNLKEISNIQKDLDNIEKIVVDKISKSSNIENNFKNLFIKSIREKINQLKQSLNDVLEKFKFKKVEMTNEMINDKKNNIILDDEMKNELLSIDTLSAKMLNSLAKDDNVFILRKISTHPNTSQATLLEIAEKTEDFKVKENLLNNPKTPTSVICKYLQDDDRDILLKALNHSNILIKDLEKFSKFEDIEIKLAVLNNKNCTIKILEDMAVKSYDNPKILNIVLRHKNCSENLKECLKSLNNTPIQTKKMSLAEKIKSKKEILANNKLNNNNKDLTQKNTLKANL